jgi:hypothetical protein
MRSALLLPAIAFSLLSGCVTTSNLATGNGSASVDMSESVVIIGVTPRYRVALVKGTPHGDSWSRDHSSVATTNTYPDDGYIVVKIPARSGTGSYGVGQILPEGIGGFAPQYVPCTGHTLVTFEAPAGKVTYVGDIQFSINGQTARYQYSHNLEQARRFLSSKYPALAAKVEGQDARLLTMDNTNCGPATLSVPVVRTR